MTVHVLALTVDVHLPTSRSLKDKRAVIRSLLDGAHRRFRVAVSETDHQDRWQRAELAFVVVSGEHHQAQQVADQVERFVWSFPDIEVLETVRDWMDLSD